MKNLKTTIQQARLLLVPTLRVLHIPRAKRSTRIGKRGPIMVVELMKAARRYIHIAPHTQALAMIAQAVILLHDPTNLFQHGEITQEQLREAALDLGPAYYDAFALLGYDPGGAEDITKALAKTLGKLGDAEAVIVDLVEQLAEAKAKAASKSKLAPSTDPVDGEKKGKTNPVATEAKQKGKPPA